GAYIRVPHEPLLHSNRSPYSIKPGTITVSQSVRARCRFPRLYRLCGTRAKDAGMTTATGQAAPAKQISNPRYLRIELFASTSSALPTDRYSRIAAYVTPWFSLRQHSAEQCHVLHA